MNIVSKFFGVVSLVLFAAAYFSTILPVTGTTPVLTLSFLGSFVTYLVLNFFFGDEEYQLTKEDFELMDPSLDQLGTIVQAKKAA